MALEDFSPISLKPDGQRVGLVWSGEVDGYLAELQTGVLPQLVHLVIFDPANDYVAVYEALQAYSSGDTLDEEAMDALAQAIADGLTSLNA